MEPLTNRRTLGAIGTTGTKTRDSRVALLLLGMLMLACGGESKQSANTSSGGNGGSSGSSCGETCSDFGGNGGSDSTTGTSSHTGSGGSGGGCSIGGDAIDPGCFGSPGPVTNGSATVTVGAGGNTSGTTDTTSVSTDGSSGSGGAGGSPNCEPQDVSGVGACDAAFGVFFLGDQCGWVGGCSCEGEDCDKAYEDEAACEAAHRACLDNGCAAQDATLVGGCEPASVFVFNGFECVAMDGCSCVGGDCDAIYSTMEDCEAAHEVCKDQELSCDEIEAAYDDYVSHTACQDDSDCVMVWGSCGIGLGGCYHAVNRRWSEAGREALSEAWTAGNCGGGICACAEPPETVVCDDGVCAFQE